jgi:integrase
LEVFSQKTQSKVVIPIYGHVQSIIDKYDGGFPSNLEGGAFNREIKNIASRVDSLSMKVDKHFTKGGKAVLLKNPKYELVSTHTARRSFATNQYLRKIPSISIMAVTGHKTEKAFLKYIKVTPDEHAQIMKEYWRSAQLT